MDSPSAPAAPDPVATANAQTNTNIASAVGSQMINMVNQSTPQGSLDYTKTGNNTYQETDANGQVHTYTIPQFTATQTYSPQEQALFNLNNQTQQNIAQIGVQQSQNIGNLLNTPLDLSNNAIEDQLYSEYSPRVNTQQANQLNSLQSQLSAQGVTQGSAAYNNAMNLNSQANNDQWNQLYLNGRSQADQELVTQRQEPINEIDALMSGSQVSNPTYGSTPSTSIAPANYEGDVQSSYADQLASYNANLSANNAMMGGIFGTAGALAGGWATGGFKL